jgi:hypothetical protein
MNLSSQRYRTQNKCANGAVKDDPGCDMRDHITTRPPPCGAARARA